jgi:hypothetical protein
MILIRFLRVSAYLRSGAACGHPQKPRKRGAVCRSEHCGKPAIRRTLPVAAPAPETRLRSGEEIAYDALVVAVGARPLEWLAGAVAVHPRARRRRVARRPDRTRRAARRPGRPGPRPADGRGGSRARGRHHDPPPRWRDTRPKVDIEWETPQLQAACTLNAAREGTRTTRSGSEDDKRRARTAAAVGQRGRTPPALGGSPTRRTLRSRPDRSRSAVHAATAGRPALCERGGSRPTLARSAPGRRGGLKARLPGAGQLALPAGSELCTNASQHAQTVPTPASRPIAKSVAGGGESPMASCRIPSAARRGG